MSLLRVDDVAVAPGERRDVEPVVAGTDGRVTMPMALVNGARPGPRLFVTGAVHGDELNGVAICQDVLAAVDPSALRGALVVVPVVNVPGARARSRYVPHRRDLNRSFPGDERGSTAERIASLVDRLVLPGATAGIDLHSAARWRTNFPQVRVTPGDEEARRLATAFGAPFGVEAALRPGSLRARGHATGIPTLTYEGGGPLRFDDLAVRTGVAGVLRVLAALDMLDGAPRPAGPTRWVGATRWLRADTPGVLRLHVDAGDEVSAGQPLWTTAGPLGETRTTTASPASGIVLGVTTLPLVSPGTAVCHLAEPQPSGRP